MSFGPYLNGFYDVGRQLPDWLLRASEEADAREEHEKRGITSVPGFQARRERVASAFMRAIGGLPALDTDLNAVCTGELDRGAYRVRKIVFQSLPGFYVTANLYLPASAGARRPGPAVLFACGHDEASKASPLYQHVCIDLVNAGMIVLAVDPLSQGERKQSYDRAAKRGIVRWHAEHTYCGLQCELTGGSIIRYFLTDLFRSIDYLVSLPEVDESRIGMTGNSGGGLQTAYMMLADPRLAAAMPCTFISSRLAYMKTGQPQDGEQNIYGALRDGINYDDFVTAFAPKPAMIGAVGSDFFVVEGVQKTFERGRAVYRMHGCDEALELALVPGTHSYNDELRRNAVEFFARVLGADAETSSAESPTVRTEDPGDLQCTASGQVHEEYADARTVVDLNAEYLDGLRAARAEPQEVSAATIAEAIGLTLTALDPSKAHPAYPRIVGERRIDNSVNLMPDLVHRDIFFFTEPDITVAGTHVSIAGREVSRCWVLLLEDGSAAIHRQNDLVNRLLQDGDVFAFDPRGHGAVQARAVNGRPFYEMFGTEYKLASDAMMLGLSLAGLRVFDVVAAARVVRELGLASSAGMAGVGFTALYALFAAALADSVDRVYLENMVDSLDGLARARAYRYDPRYHLYGILRHVDLPDIVSMLSRRMTVERVWTSDIGNTIRW